MSEKIKTYATGHQHSNVICAAFNEGCKGQLVPPLKLLNGPAAMYGILRGTDKIIKACEWLNRDYYYIDHGYINAGHYDGFYRISVNARQCNPHPHKKRPDDRWRKLNRELRPWKRSGKSILVVPLTGHIAEFYQINPREWLEQVTSEVSLWTERPIVIKPKDEGEIHDYLKDAWCVVTHSSNVAVDALLEGVPAVVLGESAAKPVSWEWANIEKPEWIEREWWVHELAYNQFTLSEMRDGTAWRLLNGN